MNPINSIWQFSSLETQTEFDSNSVPDLAKRYLRHSIADDNTLATAVRIEMTGEIKLKNWMPFTAIQVVRHGVGFVWSARASMGPAFISGYDQFLEGIGEMRWKLLGLIPVMSATGTDISRSAADRFAIERVFLPSSLCDDETKWSGIEDQCKLETRGLTPISLGLEASGRISSVSMLRWGNPDGGDFGLFPFGGFVEEEATWDGFTIPSKLRVGWHFGTDRFEDGEFFRATITHAEFK